MRNITSFMEAIPGMIPSGWLSVFNCTENITISLLSGDDFGTTGPKQKSNCFISINNEVVVTYGVAILFDLEGHDIISFLQHCHSFIESDIITALAINGNDDITSLNEPCPVVKHKFINI